MPQELHYRIPWRARGSHPGHHHGVHAGSGFTFRGHVSLLEAPDPRRFDLRASLRDPCEQLRVRSFTQATAVPVFILADLSASMGFSGITHKLALLAEFTAALGYAAYRVGDPFGFVGADTQLHPDFQQPLTLARRAADRLAMQLRDFTPTGRHARGLLAAPEFLGRRRALVFVVSDFHLPLPLVAELFAALSGHGLIPVQLRDSAEVEQLPAYGLAQVRDPESGRTRTLFLRPALTARIRAQAAAQQAALQRLCLRHGCRLLTLTDRFDPDAVTRYFYA